MKIPSYMLGEALIVNNLAQMAGFDSAPLTYARRILAENQSSIKPEQIHRRLGSTTWMILKAWNALLNGMNVLLAASTIQRCSWLFREVQKLNSLLPIDVQGTLVDYAGPSTNTAYTLTFGNQTLRVVLEQDQSKIALPMDKYGSWKNLHGTRARKDLVTFVDEMFPKWVMRQTLGYPWSDVNIIQKASDGNGFCGISDLDDLPCSTLCRLSLRGALELYGVLKTIDRLVVPDDLRRDFNSVKLGLRTINEAIEVINSREPRIMVKAV